MRSEWRRVPNFSVVNVPFLLHLRLLIVHEALQRSDAAGALGVEKPLQPESSAWGRGRAWVSVVVRMSTQETQNQKPKTKSTAESAVHLTSQRMGQSDRSLLECYTLLAKTLWNKMKLQGLFRVS
jgi:hypothetical protein